MHMSVYSLNGHKTLGYIGCSHPHLYEAYVRYFSDCSAVIALERAMSRNR
jgi:hypothetical protein